jgi:hypothetical protein
VPSTARINCKVARQEDKRGKKPSEFAMANYMQANEAYRLHW